MSCASAGPVCGVQHESNDGGVLSPDASEVDASQRVDGAPVDGALHDGPVDAAEHDAGRDGGVIPESSADAAPEAWQDAAESATVPATCNGAWHPADTMGGTGYSDNGSYSEPLKSIPVAGDGSAFTAWTAHDPTSSHVYLYASRFTPSGGWVPYRFDELAGNGAYGGGAPAVAVSENGEAMVVWTVPILADGNLSYALQSMRWANGWQAPVALDAPSRNLSPATLRVAADASGGFVAAWMEQNAITGILHMAHYDPGSGWGSVETPGPGDPDAGAAPIPFGVSLSMEAGGKALVVWSEGANHTGPQGIGAERFDPTTGWGGRETLAAHVAGQPGVSRANGALGRNGSAAVTWAELDPASQTMHAVARVYTGSWSDPVNLDDTTGGSGTSYTPSIATDASGTFLLAWLEQDPSSGQLLGNHVYASRITPGGSWSHKTLLNTNAPPDGSTSFQISPQIEMGPTGDVVVTLGEWDQKSNKDSVDVVSYSPDTGWTAPTQLDASGTVLSLPVVDACGNATVIWAQDSTHDVLASRHMRGGTWSTPSRLGTTTSQWDGVIAAGVGSSGEVVTSFRSADHHDVLAAVLR
jgi:hypothetical protein